jgi:hypothetical protein
MIEMCRCCRRKQVSDEAQELGQQQELAARGSDVRDLVVARNFNIIDVHDRDGNGKSQRAFGRIFYTEGKSLIFDAYDVSDPIKLDAKVSVYVWVNAWVPKSQSEGWVSSTTMTRMMGAG